MGKGLALPIVIFLLCLMSVGTVCVLPVKAQGTPFPTINITINADGTITQPRTYFKQTGGTYTLRGGIYGQVYGQITVLRSNAIIDGDGNTVQGKILVGNWDNQAIQAIYSPIAGMPSISNVTVEKFNVTGIPEELPGFGIETIMASNVTLTNNTVKWAGGGISSEEDNAIDVEGGGSNVIIGNNLVNDFRVIFLHQTENNLIIWNNITCTHEPFYPSIGAPGQAIILFFGSNNTIYHNNFIDNDVQVYDASPLSHNVWDDGYPLGGNYWSDYQSKYPNVTEINSLGIGDTSYVIDKNNTDHYPLMQPFTNAIYALQTTSPKVLVLSSLNQTFVNSTVSLVFSANRG